jgi:hypothetical protein
MKKTLVSVGLAAAGAAILPSASAQDMQAAASPKIWNVGSTLRGFYDDNYTVSHTKNSSFGFEVSPSVSANVALQQTDIGVKYTFGLYFYLKRSNDGQPPFDYTHQADLWLDHAFNERYKLNVSDSFVVAQDPKLVQGGTPQRVSGNNVANRGLITLNAEWTREFSTSTHYGNNFYLFSNNGGGTPDPANPTDAALLNRIEQNFGNDFQWNYTDQTMFFVGYTFSWVRYTGNAAISDYAGFKPNGNPAYYTSESRNYNSHYGYLGVTEEFSPNLTGTARVGAYYTDNYADPISPYNELAPYADINVVYTYIPGSYVQAGFTQNQNSTDVVAPSSSGHLTQYQNTSTIYGTVNHQITPLLTGSLIGQYSYFSYQDGQYGGSGDNELYSGVSLTYEINHNISANAGYNFDELFSNIAGRSYSRNVVYLGLTANY